MIRLAVGGCGGKDGVCPEPLGAAHGDQNHLFESQKVKFGSAVSRGCVARAGGDRDALPQGGWHLGQWLVLVKLPLGWRFWRCEGVGDVTTV